jgi:hypothetical protein
MRVRLINELIKTRRDVPVAAPTPQHTGDKKIMTQ